MSVSRNIKEYLDSQQIRYEHLIHPLAYTAQETAEAQHVSGDELAKTVMVMADGRLVMVVLPASHRIDFPLLKECLRAEEVRLAEEREFEKVFPGCEVGAMPPLGNLYHLEVWVDASLEERADVVFNAGTHTDTVRMTYADFDRIVQPHHERFAVIEKQAPGQPT